MPGLILWGTAATTFAYLIYLALRLGPIDRSLVRRRGLARSIRWYRALWFRAFAAVASWPHGFEVLLGATRARATTSESDVVWTDGKATLIRYRGGRSGEAVLIVHAVVSMPWILDLAPGPSLIGSLIDEGFDVYLLDWGVPAPECGLTEYALTLMTAEIAVCESSASEHIHMIGYCSGGTVALARLAAAKHDHVASASFIATPVDTAVPGGMRTVLANRFFKPALALNGAGYVPGALVRESFHALRPRALRSVFARIRMRGKASEVSKMDPFSRWAWTHRALPGAMFFDMVDLYRSNSLVAGTLEVDGHRADLTTIKTPMMIAVADRDHIVPSGSSTALAGISRSEVLHCPSGHVSMLTGTGASTLRPGVARFIHDNATVRSAERPQIRRPRAGSKPPRARR